jgi:hypothetical protein
MAGSVFDFRVQWRKERAAVARRVRRCIVFTREI